MPTDTVRFQGAQEQTISGLLDRPERPRAFALFAHCFTCSKNLKVVANIARALNDEGIGLLEAPRGTLFHHYRIDDHDQITMCNLIVSTTSSLLLSDSAASVAFKSHVST